jgi:cytochrome c6
MKRIAVALAALFALALAAPASAAEGKDLFAKKCAACHGPDGKGKTPMGQKMGAKDISATKDSEADIVKDIQNGKGKMPAVKGMTAEEAQAVAKYVKGGIK